MFSQFSPFQTPDPQISVLLVVIALWTLFWKLIGLWKAARHNQKAWFVAIFLINMLGILELIYLGFFQKGEKNIIQKLKEKRASKKLLSKHK